MKIEKLYLLAITFFVIAGLYAQDDRPNILLIIADDLGVDRLSGYHAGGLMATTPTLDSLRSVGITFTNVFAAPKCTPSRAAIMSGKFGVKTGVLGTPGNLDFIHTSLFQKIDEQTDAAYADALIGKWHLNSPQDPDAPNQFGIDHFAGFLGSSPESYFDWTRTVDGVTSNSTAYATSQFTDDALSWLNGQNAPWFLWLAHAAPHGPFHEPPAGTFTVNNPSNNIRRYVAMVENLDFEIGRLLATFSEETRENTLIIFVGDNGTPANVMQDYPDGRGKSTLYQGGVRVPLIVSGHGVERIGEREDALTHLVDIHATILEATGAELPGGSFNSLSFHHLLSGTPGSTRDYNYSEIFANDETDGFTIRNQRYKLIDFDSGIQEFYDLSIDSFEAENLLLADLSAEQLTALADLETEAAVTRVGWSCRDHIQNGEETGIDCGTDACGNCISNLSKFTSSLPIEVFPNPANSTIWVEADGHLLNSVTIYDQQGRLVLKQDNIGNSRTNIMLPDQSKGAIIVVVTTAVGARTFRVVVE